MSIDVVEKIMHEAVKAPDDEKVRNQYCDAVVDYLKESKTPEEILPIVLQGIDIDNAANYYDYLDSAPKNQIQDKWKSIKKKLKELDNTPIPVLKFLAGLLSQTLMKGSNLEPLCGKVMSELVSMVTSKKKPVAINTYRPILKDYLVDDLNPKTSFPKWETINASEENCKKFAEILLEVTDGEDEQKYRAIRQCASQGINIANERIRKKEIESRIPESRIQEMEEIVSHYTVVEKEIRKAIYEVERLKEDIKRLHDKISTLESEKLELIKQIKSLNAEKEATQQMLEKAEKEVRERAALNDAFGALKKNDESAMLKDIAEELGAIYKDYIDSESDKMDVELGEIYREKLKEIFKILDKKGIRMA